MSDAAKAYAYTATLTTNPHEIKAQLLLKAASKLQALIDRGDVTHANRAQASDALEFNSKAWMLFLRESTDDESPYPPEHRKNMQEIGTYMLAQTWALAVTHPDLEEVKPLIEINRIIASGLRGNPVIPSNQVSPNRAPSGQLSTQR